MFRSVIRRGNDLLGLRLLFSHLAVATQANYPVPKGFLTGCFNNSNKEQLSFFFPIPQIIFFKKDVRALLHFSTHVVTDKILSYRDRESFRIKNVLR